MSAVGGRGPVYAVAMKGGGSGQALYQLAPAETWTLRTLAFVVDLSNALGDDEVWVRLLTQDDVQIAAVPMNIDQAVGDVVSYVLGQDLNPCDSSTSAYQNIVLDTFVPIMLTDGCQVIIEARDGTTGDVDTLAAILDGVAWVEDAAALAAPTLSPLLVPAPLSLSGFAVGG